MSIITLTTDFGVRDHLVGSMKGVILGINPQVTIVDISHEIAPHDVREAAYVIRAAYRDFPKGTIHVVVVDPGVGSARRPLLVTGQSGAFLAPDNGVLSAVWREDGPTRTIHLAETRYFRPSQGSTFHGRDIFAPVAAWLSTGIPPERFGTEVQATVVLPAVTPLVKGQTIHGQVEYVDRFGNLITNITDVHLAALAPAASRRRLQVQVKAHTIDGLAEYYGQVVQGQAGALINHAGALELFVYQGNAQDALQVERGDTVRVSVNNDK